MTDNSLAITKIGDLANPTRFLALVARILPWFASITALLFVIGLYLGFASETDYQQGDTVRIMYVHVPSAWLAMFGYSIMAAASAVALIFRHPLADLCVLADLPPRTVRYYVQIGLVDRPEGETRAARYGARHLEQLLQIRKWTAAGVSLERIRAGRARPVPPARQRHTATGP